MQESIASENDEIQQSSGSFLTLIRAKRKENCELEKTSKELKLKCDVLKSENVYFKSNEIFKNIAIYFSI